MSRKLHLSKMCIRKNTSQPACARANEKSEGMPAYIHSKVESISASHAEQNPREATATGQPHNVQARNTT